MIKNLTKNKPIFIAEIGMNHNGNFDLAYELIYQAKISGASLVKFQIGWRDKKNEINFIDHEILKKLFKISDSLSMPIFFSIISDEGFKKIDRYNLPIIKIASRTLKENFGLAQKIINKKKLTIVSLGMWYKKKKPFAKNKNIKYLWCQSEYPLYPWKIKNFPKNFSKEQLDGYSDHTVGIDMPLLAISRGAKIIEKHFTLDKSDTTIRDHALSANPKEFRNLVNIGTELFVKVNKFKI